MKTKILIPLVIIFLTSCGGGSNNTSSLIEGTWRGSLIQGGMSCSDGTFIGAGSGSVVSNVVLDVRGTDAIGSTVQAVDGNCLLEGIRDAEGFKAKVVSGCNGALDHLRFSIISKDKAGLSLHYDINKIPAGPNGVRCMTIPSGTITR